MTNRRVFETESIDLGAYLTAADYSPTIYRKSTGNRATFKFSESDDLQYTDRHAGGPTPGLSPVQRSNI
jgi:hypothetical protein